MSISDPTPYVRGTKTERIKTARLVPGDRVLTENAQSSERLPHAATPRLVQAAQTKTSGVIRVVDRIDSVLAYGGRRRAQRSYAVYFTDGTATAFNNAPIYTWHALVVDREGSASRQHFIDTGAYLTPAEVAEFATQEA